MAGASPIELESALGRFGLSAFRPGQAEVITQVLAGQDCLCVMPTGGGKSLCYQLPAIVRNGLTIVVSPLIALMKDQVDGLVRRGIPATLINSSLSTYEQNARLQDVVDGKYRLVYVAPERLKNQRFMDAIRATPIQLLAIDEAHCISEWGHDFRPDYARIGKFREALGGVQTIALTATATPRVREDICNILRLRSPKMFITGFARTNLHFGALVCHSDREKDWALCDFLKTKPGFGIIYASSRKRCEGIVEMLVRELKIRVAAYHAGLLVEDRKAVQERFMRGELDVIVATNAFGMGIDKSDLRYVIHYNMPGSLEAYYQEAGRAGRDGQPSLCLMMFSYQDRYIHEFFIENSYPPRDFVKTVYEFMQERIEDPIELTLEEIREALNLPLSSEAVGTSLQWIARSGVIDRLEAGAGLAMVRISSDLPTLVNLLPRESKNRRKVLHALEKAVGDRRFEAVYVHPRWLMQHTELDRDSLNRALKELCKLEAIEYVPPFRGRAVHFRKKDVAFDQLGIDFEALAKRKAAEYEKLEQTIGFAQARQCRQLTILQYFGDPSAQVCGNCDRCQGTLGWPQLDLTSEKPVVKIPEKVVDLDHIKPLVVRVLQAVGRTHGRLGKILIAQFLCGSENAKLQRLRLQRLDGFGMLNQLKQADTVKLLDSLLSCGLMQQQEVNKHRPTVSLTEFGQKVSELREPMPTALRLETKLVDKLAAIVGVSPASVIERKEVVEPKEDAGNRSAKADSAKVSTPSQKVASSAGDANSLRPLSIPAESLKPDVAGKPTAGKPELLNADAGRSASTTRSSQPSGIEGSDSKRALVGSPAEKAKPVDQAKLHAPDKQPQQAKQPQAESTPGAMGDPSEPPRPTPSGYQHVRVDQKQQLLPNWDSVNRELAAPSEATSAKAASRPLADWVWTWRVAEHGFLLMEIAAIRRKSTDEIVRDLLVAIEQGKSIKLATLFTSDLIAAVERGQPIQPAGDLSKAALVECLKRFKVAIANREKAANLTRNSNG